MHWLLDRATQLTNLKRETPCPAVVSLIPGFFLFNAATGLVELVSIGPSAPAALLTSIVTSGATAFLIIMAMTFGLILPRMLFERVLPSPA